MMIERACRGYEMVIKNSHEEVSRAIYEFINFCNEQSIALSTIYKLRLAMEEILVNAINYSFLDKNLHDIHIKITYDAERVCIEFLDDGIEFNPLTAPEPKDIPLDERIPGGIGIYLVKTMMDTFEYKRSNEKNILTISKKTT
ncbi:MAG: histidine kinase [Ignavibacteria bacterium CG22_combo_CG10-13_8_21_14_all_37_15]|nr:MAG: histidine kinase [Ignavibacteria bacterium CG22_combo_CG10-13_8_21_14_all_37_15]PIS45262.1 MAG: ATP-binding protein [Ignavibacteria bacterium CG08_land_8_20_14_0_20_37_9]